MSLCGTGESLRHLGLIGADDLGNAYVSGLLAQAVAMS